MSELSGQSIREAVLSVIGEYEPQLELYATVTEGDQRTTTQASMTDKPRSSSAPLETVAAGPSRSDGEVQDETSGCAFDGSYELISNGRTFLLNFTSPCRERS